MQRTVLDKQCCNRAAPLVKARFYDGSLRQTIRICFQIRNLCDKIDVLKQIVDSLAGECGNRAANGIAAPLFRNKAVFGQLLHNLIRIGMRFIDFVNSHDD